MEDGITTSLVEVNELVTTLSSTRSSGEYNYLGQFNGHSYFSTSWGQNFEDSRDQANADGGYLVVINSEEEREF